MSNGVSYIRLDYLAQVPKAMTLSLAVTWRVERPIVGLKSSSGRQETLINPGLGGSFLYLLSGKKPMLSSAK
jgi:hypothetical protein